MKKVFFKTLKPVSYLIREFMQKDKITIVLFHNPTRESIEGIYDFYNKYYNIISLEEYLKRKENNTIDTLPKKSIVITFDDGWKNNYNLLDVFIKYKVKPTIFLTTSLIDTHKDFLTEEQVLNMNEYVDFQSHTVSHIDMKKEFNEEILKEELYKSKVFLEKILNKDINIFAYPFGRYKESDIKLLKNLNYKYALTVDLGFNKNNNNFLLKRICLSDNPSHDELYVKSTGVWEFIKNKLKRKNNNENFSLL